MRFGVQLPHFGPLASGPGAVSIARRAEALGFDSVWVGDHLAYPPSLADRFGSEFHEALVTLSYLAAATSRVRLGTAVLVLPYRHPVLLARQLATLDVLSAGRVTVGVGTGWLAEEFAALGVPFADRGALTDESLRIVRALWTEDPPSFAGRFFTVPEVTARPRPLQRPTPPVWVGGNTPRALRRAAELGDGWLPIWHAPTGRGFAPSELRLRVEELAARAASAGRRVRHEIGGLMPVALPEASPAGGELPLVGPPGRVVDMLGRYREAGLHHVILTPVYGVPAGLQPKDLAEFERLLERFASEVRPQLGATPRLPGPVGPD
jgi:probable F420-dependent oxidoreductase